MPCPERTSVPRGGRVTVSERSDDADDWDRRHAETRSRTRDRNVRAPPLEDDWEHRHGRCQ